MFKMHILDHDKGYSLRFLHNHQHNLHYSRGIFQCLLRNTSSTHINSDIRHHKLQGTHQFHSGYIRFEYHLLSRSHRMCWHRAFHLHSLHSQLFWMVQKVGDYDDVLHTALQQKNHAFAKRVSRHREADWVQATLGLTYEALARRSVWSRKTS